MDDPGIRPEYMYIYGPPKSKRKRLANRLRKLFGYEEQWEVYHRLKVEYADNEPRGAAATLTWNKTGEMLVTVNDEESPGSTPTVQG